METFGNRLNALISASKYRSRYAFAKAAKTSDGYLSDCVNGKMAPDEGRLREWCNLLEINLDGDEFRSLVESCALQRSATTKLGKEGSKIRDQRIADQERQVAELSKEIARLSDFSAQFEELQAAYLRIAREAIQPGGLSAATLKRLRTLVDAHAP